MQNLSNELEEKESKVKEIVKDLAEKEDILTKCKFGLYTQEELKDL
mgnify:CR=1 FL=1